MAQGKLSPRQRMINMMYLVLTALLALNVSKEIINAFVTVNDSLEISNMNAEDKNKLTYAAFDRAMQIDPKKYGGVNSNAQNIKKASDEMVTYLQNIEDTLIRLADGLKPEEKTPALRDMELKDNWDIPTMIMCGSENDGKGKKASEVKQKIEDLKATLLKNLPSQYQADFKQRLDQLLGTHDPDPSSAEYKEDDKRTWEMSKFYHSPVVAADAILTKFQGDVRNAESQVIGKLYSSVNEKIVSFDLLKPIVKFPSNYILLGGEYDADVFIGASSSTMDPEVYVGATTNAVNGNPGNKCVGCNTKLPIDPVSRMAKFTDKPSSEGEKKWSGVIAVKQPDNTYQYYPFEESYIAAKPNYTISADNMNVLYIGPDNPITISVPGVPSEKVKPSASGCGVVLKPSPTAGKGHYIATVTSSGEVKVAVTAEINGKEQAMGQPYTFRVKKVPTPVATANGTYHSGPINKDILSVSNIIPVMEGFDFKLYYAVTGFKMTVVQKGKDPIMDLSSDNSQLTDKMRNAIKSLHPGDKVYIEYIKARMTSGTDLGPRSLEPLSFTIN